MHEGRVTGGVPKAVIEALESIQVHRDGTYSASGIGLFEYLLHYFLQEGAVGESGKWVVHGAVGQQL